MVGFIIWACVGTGSARSGSVEEGVMLHSWSTYVMLSVISSAAQYRRKAAQNAGEVKIKTFLLTWLHM